MGHFSLSISMYIHVHSPYNVHVYYVCDNSWDSQTLCVVDTVCNIHVLLFSQANKITLTRDPEMVGQ